MRSWRWYSKVLFALLVAAFAYWVWPTPWRDHSVDALGTPLLVRENRLTGHTQMKGIGGTEWRDFKR